MSKKAIHFVGIKGVGMAALAIIAKQAGCEVSGCDVEQQFITDESLKKAGITPFKGFSFDHLKSVQLVITTGAHGGFSNPEIQAAKRLAIPVLSHGEALGIMMQGKLIGKSGVQGISVAGTHGKTTTTAMIATIFSYAHLDPTYLIGTSSISSLGSPGHFGKGSYFIAEADEYATEPSFDKTPRFLWQHPTVAVITNIDFDHPDIYTSIEEAREAFARFTKNILPQGILVACGDDPQVRLLLKEFSGTVITYGFSQINEYVIKRTSISSGQTFFWVEMRGIDLGEFTINVLGEHNALNALASIVVALEMGIHLEKIKKALLTFSGSKRRSEFIGKTSNGALIFDDYAHHPTEIKKTLKAFRSAYKNYRIIPVFQPHTFSRTNILFDQFLSSFNDADEVIVTEIYASQREQKDDSISSRKIVDEINKLKPHAIFLSSLSDVIEYINKKKYAQNTILLTMGAGDVYKVGLELVNNYKILNIK